MGHAQLFAIADSHIRSNCIMMTAGIYKSHNVTLPASNALRARMGVMSRETNTRKQTAARALSSSSTHCINGSQTASSVNLVLSLHTATGEF